MPATAVENSKVFFVWTKPLDCWWRGWWRGLPAAAIDSSSPSFFETPFWSSVQAQLLAGQESSCQQLLLKTATTYVKCMWIYVVNQTMCKPFIYSLNQFMATWMLEVIQTWWFQLLNGIPWVQTTHYYRWETYQFNNVWIVLILNEDTNYIYLGFTST